MTINIGSKKIARLAIGQSDGTAKDLKQLNLGEKVIFKKETDYFPLPSNPDSNSFYIGMPHYEQDKAQYGVPKYARLYNPIQASIGIMYVNVWYKKPYNRSADYITSISPNSVKELHSDSNFHLENLTNETLFELRYANSNVFKNYYNNPGDGALIRIADDNLGINNLFKVVLSSMPDLSLFLTDSNYINAFKYFNYRGSIYDMSDNCFIFPPTAIGLNIFAFEGFNQGGLLHRIPPNAFDTTNIRTMYASYLNTFNGTSSQPGGLQSNHISSLTSYNTVMTNKTSENITVVGSNGATTSIKPNQAFEWNSAS